MQLLVPTPLTKLTSAVAGVTLQGLLCVSLCPSTCRSLHSVGVWLERLLVSSFADRYAALGADRLTKSAVDGVTLSHRLSVSLCVHPLVDLCIVLVCD